MLIPLEKYSLFKILTWQDDEEYAVVVNLQLLLKRRERDTTILRWGLPYLILGGGVAMFDRWFHFFSFGIISCVNIQILGRHILSHWRNFITWHKNIQRRPHRYYWRRSRWIFWCDVIKLRCNKIASRDMLNLLGEEQRILLRHPTIVTLIDHKWRRYYSIIRWCLVLLFKLQWKYDICHWHCL